MSEGPNAPSRPEIAPPREQVEHVRKLLSELPNKVRIAFFTKKGENDVFNRAARQILELLSGLTEKVLLEQYDIAHPLGARLGVERSPTIIFAPEKFSIWYVGAPLGEEGRTLVETILLVGSGSSGLSDQSLKVMARIDTPRTVRVFVNSTCPYCPQQAVNAVRAAIEKPELVSVEIVDTSANPDLADRYSAHSVPQTFAGEVLIARGAQPEELFLLSLERMEQQAVFVPQSDEEEVQADLVIVGGGPAGLTAGIYAARSGIKAVVVERGLLGGQVATTPVVENYPGFTMVGGKTLVDLMVTHALEYVQIFQGEEVREIRPGLPIKVDSTRRRFFPKAVLLATGASYRKAGIPGEARLAGRGVSYCATCDGPLFKGKRVVIVGGGNSAVTEAIALHNLGVEVTLVHRRDTLRAQAYLVENLRASRIPVLWDTEVQEIRGEARVEDVVLRNLRTGKRDTLPVAGVFIAIGYEPAVELARKTGVKLTPDGFIWHDGRHRTSVPGVYSAGDVEGGFRQIVTAVAQGAEASLAIFEDLVRPYWKRQTGGEDGEGAGGPHGDGRPET